MTNNCEERFNELDLLTDKLGIRVGANTDDIKNIKSKVETNKRCIGSQFSAAMNEIRVIKGRLNSLEKIKKFGGMDGRNLIFQ